MSNHTTTHKLAILGPNLANERDIRFIVHAQGCRDIARDERRNRIHPEERWSASWVSESAVIDDVYDFIGGENSEDGDPTWPSDRPEYRMEFDFKPCCGIPA